LTGPIRRANYEWEFGFGFPRPKSLITKMLDLAKREAPEVFFLKKRVSGHFTILTLRSNSFHGDGASE
jgi:hypothetical protein